MLSRYYLLLLMFCPCARHRAIRADRRLFLPPGVRSIGTVVIRPLKAGHAISSVAKGANNDVR